MDEFGDLSALIDDEPNPRDLVALLRKREALGELMAAGGPALAPQAQATLGGTRARQQAVLNRALAAQRARTQAVNDALEARTAQENRLYREKELDERKRHNRAMEVRPPSFPIIMTPEGQFRVDPRNPGAPAVPVVGPDGKPLAPPPKTQPRMTDRTKDDLNTMATTAESVSRLESEFKDEFAGGGFLGEAKTAAAKAAGSWAPEDAQSAAAFWADWDKLINLPERNAIFGASLSGSEKASWEGARNIKPGADPKLVRKKLADLKAITRKRGRALADSAVAEGYDPEAVKALTRGAFGAGEAETNVKASDLRSKYGLK